MTNTTNYNLILAEGTDLVNYLTQTNPNFSDLDTIIKGISDATVTTASEVASGTAHAITRTLPDANVIRFTATSNWVLGDTMTIDGTPVTVVKPNGTNLQTGDYVIGAEVLGVIRATQFTVYVGGGASTIDAEDVDYDNTVSGLTATDVQAAIDEEAAAITTINSNLSWLNNSFTQLTPSPVTAGATVPYDMSIYHEIAVLVAHSSAELATTVRRYGQFDNSILATGLAFQMQYSVGNVGYSSEFKYVSADQEIAFTGGGGYALIYAR